MDWFVLVARLKPHALEHARELAAQVDPSAVADFDRFGVFLSKGEVVFVFEGEHARETVRAHLNDPVESTALSPWIPLFDGPLHAAREVYPADAGA